MTYAIWLKESGEGCDYTVGCGEKLIMVDDLPTDEKLSALLEDYGNDPDRFSKIVILKVERKLSSAEIADLCHEDDEDEEDERFVRRAQYEALKKEFG